MPRHFGKTPSSAILPKLKLYSEARHVSPAVTTDVQPVSQPCYGNCSGTLSSSVKPVAKYWCCTVSAMDWLPFLPQSVSSQLWSTPEGSQPATDKSIATQACTIKPSFLVHSDYGTPCQLMSASCHLTVLRLNWTPSSWCNYRPAMFLIAPLHCFYWLLFGFIKCFPMVPPKTYVCLLLC